MLAANVCIVYMAVFSNGAKCYFLTGAVRGAQGLV